MIKILIYLFFFIIIYKIFNFIKITSNSNNDIIDAEYEEIE